jgi:hypothetical protein
MSIFGFYFVSSLLREAGWPKKRGFFKKQAIDTIILDGVIDQMVEWAAAIGAGRPTLALQTIAEIFRDRDWSSDSAPSIKQFIESARAEIESWRVTNASAPHDAVKLSRFARTGPTVDATLLTDERIRLGLEQWFLEGVLWGFANPEVFEKWYNSRFEDQSRRLPFMRQSGLVIDALPDLPQFLVNSEEFLRSYEREIGPLPAIPERLLAEARALGREV